MRRRSYGRRRGYARRGYGRRRGFRVRRARLSRGGYLL